MVESGKAKERARTWPTGIAAARRGASDGARSLSHLWQTAAKKLREWALVDVGPGRLIPWLPIAFGTRHRSLFHRRSRAGLVGGTHAYHLRRYPGAIWLRARPVAFPVMLGIAAIAAGFCDRNAQEPCASHIPVLAFPVGNAELSGFVEIREERERSDRFVLRIHRMEGGAVRHQARTRAALCAQGHGARGRLVRCAEGAAQSAARAAAARRL